MSFPQAKPILLITLSLALCIVSSLAAAEKLEAREYAKRKDTMSVVFVDVNWGRSWECAGYENAQLVNLKFELVSTAEEHSGDKYSEIVLKTPSRLFVNPEYLSYGFIVHPGDYALTEFKIKAAKTMPDVGYIGADRSQLVDGNTYHGGIIRVGAGEVVYVGHFFVDCAVSPIPWRYYAEGKETFVSYVAEKRKKFRFLEDVEFTYRLFNTRHYGVDHNFRSGLDSEFAGDYVAARDSFERALEFARSSGATPDYVSAVLYNLGRMYAYSCDARNGIRYLVEALELERTLGKSDNANIVKRLSELARLSYDTGEYQTSANYYAEAIAYLEPPACRPTAYLECPPTAGYQSDDPIGYANYILAYAMALDETGATDTADEMRDRASILQSENDGKAAEFTPVEYRDICGDLAAP